LPALHAQVRANGVRLTLQDPPDSEHLEKLLPTLQRGTADAIDALRERVPRVSGTYPPGDPRAYNSAKPPNRREGMRAIRRYLHVLVPLLASCAAAFAAHAQVIGLSVTPPAASMEIGTTQQFRATVTALNGSITDVTALAAWSTSAAQVATIDSAGIATAVDYGSATITATFLTFTATASVEVDGPLPPDPATIAPLLRDVSVSSVLDEVSFLYAGAVVVQTGVASDAITEERVAVVRGRVLDRAGQPMRAVKVSVRGRPEFGRTVTRTDGAYDLAVQGGGPLTLQFQKHGYIASRRIVAPLWNEQIVVDDVVLIPYDGAVTTIAANSSNAQVARGSVVTDGDGSRRATLYVKPGTGASLWFAEQPSQPIASLSVRATEFTVGASGALAMPATLPPTSAYTYCVELSADEAIAAAADEVRFSKPLSLYVENFIGFPVGAIVPVGYFDRLASHWEGADNGRVIKILSTTGGVAQIDTDGDGTADSPAAVAALGIDATEAQTLATLYTAGQTLWRVPIDHFTPWDANWPYGPPSGAVAPAQPKPATNQSVSDPTGACGYSLIDCHNQSLQKSIAVAGTPFSLLYDSARVARTQYGLEVSLTGTNVPLPLERIELTIRIAGQTYRQSFAPQAQLTHRFDWDGRDVYGRLVQGARDVYVDVGYVYEPVYVEPSNAAVAWATTTGVPITGIGGTPVRGRGELTMHQTWTLPLGDYAAPRRGFGGWTLDVERFYDGRGRVLYDAGQRRAADPHANKRLTLRTIAGTGRCCTSGDGGPAAQAGLEHPISVAVASDGTVYFQDTYRIRRIDRQGVVTTVAGTNSSGFTPDGLPAAGNPIWPWGIAIGPDDTLYFNDARNWRVRRVVDGLLQTVAGNGMYGYCGRACDGQYALQVPLDAGDIAFGPDGTLYIADGSIKAVGRDYRIRTVSDDPMLNANSVAVAPDGTIYAADNLRNVYRIEAGGGAARLWAGGSGSLPPLADGNAATTGVLKRPRGMHVAGDGTLLVSELQAHRIRAIAMHGIATTLAGTGLAACYDCLPPSGQLARGSKVSHPEDVTVGPDGSVYIADSGHYAIRRSQPVFPAVRSGSAVVASADGSVVYVFENGQHARTMDSVTGARLWSFQRDAHGHVTAITDVDGNVTAIERNAAGEATAIVAPGGQRTLLAVSAAGRLDSITKPGGEVHQFTYDSRGLMTARQDARGNSYAYSWNADGQLLQATDPEGGFIRLTRASASGSRAVTRESAEGRISAYDVTVRADESERRATTGTDGLTTETIEAGATYDATLPDGTTVRAVQSPDGRFGSQSALAGSLTLRRPSGATLQLTHTRQVTLTDPADPLSVASVAETMKVNGRQFSTTYDAATRQVTSTSAAGRTATATLDAKGRRIATAVPGLTQVTFGYDAVGRLTSAAAGSRALTLTWNAKNELTGMTDALSRSVGFSYDAAGRVVEQTLPGGRLVAFTYDPNGNLLSVTPPGRQPHIFTYTKVDAASAYAPPAVTPGGATSYGYNQDRQLETITRPDGTLIEFGYDSAGRLSSLTTPAGVHQYTWSPATGMLSSIASPGGVGAVAYSYDGMLVTGTQWTGAVAGAVTHAYDAEMRVTNENGAAFAYDADGLLITAGALTLRRSASNGLLSGTDLGVVTDSYTYNAFGEVTGYSATAASTPLLAYTYTRDPGGRITAEGGRGYEYDTTGRLIRVTAGSTPIAEYDYDTNGNRTAHRYLGGSVSATYDEQDRLLTYGDTTYAYNANGELQSKTVVGVTTTYAYDANGHLQSVTTPAGTIDYVIDGQGRRIGKKVDGVLVQGWLYADQLRIVAELDGTNAVVSRFVYGTRTNVPDYVVRGGAVYRILTDHLGSPRLIVNTANGTIAQQLQYDEFGRVLTDTNPGFQPFGFAGGLYDRDTGLVRFGARDYDPQTGRWTAKDPSLFGGRSANLYGYTWNDPVNYVDETGEAGVKITAAKGGGGSVTIGHDRGRNFVKGRVGVGYGGGFKVDPLAGLPQGSTVCETTGYLGVGAGVALNLGPLSLEYNISTGMVISDHPDRVADVDGVGGATPNMTFRWKDGWGFNISGTAGFEAGYAWGGESSCECPSAAQ
jgi:RHS repeat-associated protein